MSAIAGNVHLPRLFSERFPGQAARWLVTCPGRINLIGEHTDYNGFPVMPIALARAIRLCASPAGAPMVQLKNVDVAHHEDREFEVARDIPCWPTGDWGNYAKAAVQSLVRLWEDQGKDLSELEGMRCLVGGTLPAAGGLASSSALVVACALAFAACNEWHELLAPPEGVRALAERMAQAEHYVGTQGGGMDQAVCLLAREGHALRIDFFPLRVRHVPFPEGHVILAAHSTVPSAKARGRRLAYNRRVLECAIGKDLLARRMGVPDAERLGDLCSAEDPDALQRLTDELTEITHAKDSLTLAEAAALLELRPDDFRATHLRMKDGSILPTPDDGLKVLPRCRHVLGEAARVESAVRCLEAADVTGLGTLMNESHRSCARDYEISSPELDTLVEMMQDSGCLGARLTGAGFGGFAIGLAQKDAAHCIRDRLEREFYAPRGLSARGQVFTFTPARGARVERVPAPS